MITVKIQISQDGKTSTIVSGRSCPFPGCTNHRKNKGRGATGLVKLAGLCEKHRKERKMLRSMRDKAIACISYLDKLSVGQS